MDPNGPYNHFGSYSDAPYGGDYNFNPGRQGQPLIQGSWQDESFELPPRPEPTRSGADQDINADEINRFVNSTNQAPYAPGAQRPIPTASAWHAQSFPGAPGPFTEPQLGQYGRSATSGRSSATVPDSAYQSLNSISGLPAPRLLQHTSHPDYARAGFQASASPGDAVSDPGVDRGRRLQVPQTKSTRSRTKSAVQDCWCGRKLKNPSDAHKHELQHQKPFRCDDTTCTRTDGFATQNDLQRHRHSVHGQKPLCGRQNGYVCAACPPPQNGTRPKFWPRRDNYKAHIRRKHTNWIEEELLRQSESLRPEDALTESGYASAPSQTDPLEQSHQQDTSSPMGPGLPSQVHQPGDFPLFNLGQNSGMDELAGVGQGPLADPSMGHREPDIGLHVPNNSSGYGLSVLSDAAATMGSHQSPKDSVMPTPDTPFGAIPSVRVSQYRFGADQNHGLAQMQWPEGPSGSPKRKMSHDGREGEHSGHPDGDFECEVCGKRKKRDCDRRKHMKRHTRPYGCTFPNCWKRFGSRNDWKRHENSQHFLAEMWRCELLGPGNHKCGKLHHNGNAMRTHLTRKHTTLLQQEMVLQRGVQFQQLVRHKVTEMHLGQEGHYHFWCGFCNQLIAQKEGTHNAWKERFKHIGDHYDKNDANIDKWICIEANKRKGSITKADRKKAKQRLRVGGLEEEDSDLGDSGIAGIGGPSPSLFNSAPGFTAPPRAFSPPTGHGPGMAMQGAAQDTSNKRRCIEFAVDVDADNVSDDGWQNAGAGGMNWTQC